ncbi:MAG TPA: Holliday junction branch migration protein RuvA [Patescibacteria group bacterium]|nr:Holliday junction branch migration protein RuvA [Patescibacteria group bacterium]
MIASIEGSIEAKDGNRLIVGIAGVGFEIFVPARNLAEIGEVGDRVRLRTYLHVREDALTVYGFVDEDEKQLFQALLSVSGVGPKVALAILSAVDAGELARLIYEEKPHELTSFPGIGKKTAERIILELRDRLDFDRYLARKRIATGVIDRELMKEAIAALANLGLSRMNAEKALLRITKEDLGDSFGVEDVVREALKKV